MTGEHLGPATINGVNAIGLRTITVIPAGTEGNEHELKRSNETWRSTELNLVIRSISEDPQTGITDIELTEIDRSNPAPSLFEPPSGYRMQTCYALIKFAPTAEITILGDNSAYCSVFQLHIGTAY